MYRSEEHKVCQDRICSLTPHTSQNTPVYEYAYIMQDTFVQFFIRTLKRAEESDSIIKSNINLRRHRSIEARQGNMSSEIK